MIKYIFITGGVVSSIGKGILAASLGRLLKSRGLKVTIQKLDPYINVDAGTMNPYQHGEVFVTEDGAETDLDLGHYERFIDENLSGDSNLTTGKIYGTVISKERKGDYLGDTVRVIPHITDCIKSAIQQTAKKSNCQISLVEIGGTIGDIESLPFLEAIRQLKSDVGEKNVVYIHLTLIPHLGSAGELKTKPTQHSVKELRSIGIQPDIIICRTQKPLTKEIIKKIALYCDVAPDAVIESKDAEHIYEVPLFLEKAGLGNLVSEKLNLDKSAPKLKDWGKLICSLKQPTKTVRIGIIGKYIQLKDAYLSIVEALKHGGISNQTEVKIIRIDAERLSERNLSKKLRNLDGILVPGGFGTRGTDGKIRAIKFARINKVPFLGICYGLQCAVVEFAKNAARLKRANSTEIDSGTPNPVIDILPEQRKLKKLGGTMRLGAYRCRIKKDSLAYSAYKKTLISERHRHRYEFNNKFRDVLEKNGLRVTGINPDHNLVEILELKNHPWFVAVQFHPEFKSHPNKPHPLFKEFVKAALERRDYRES